MPTVVGQFQERASATAYRSPASSRARFVNPGLDSGRPLDSGAPQELETGLDHDFSQVRIHTDRRAADSARAVGARAYTTGNDIVFGEGEYRPDTTDGRRLLAHEMVHVVQQRGGRAARPRTIGAAGSPAEREATAVADRVAGDGLAPEIVRTVPAGTVQRQVDDQDDSVPAPAPVQTPIAPWSPARRGTFSIMVESAKVLPDDCFGHASSGAGASPLSSCGYIEHFCTTPARFPLRVRFYTDAMNLPRPQPFQGPEVSVSLSFVPEGGGSPTYSRSATDGNPGYAGPGHWLLPGFGTDFTVTSGGSGTLAINLGLRDAASGVSVTYIDNVRCHLAPCA